MNSGSVSRLIGGYPVAKVAGLPYSQYRFYVLKHEALMEYGPCCGCCGETNEEFLTTEHGQNDGARWRKTFSWGPTHGCGQTFAYWLFLHDYPTNLGLEVLCANCQQGRLLNGGACPHEGNP